MEDKPEEKLTTIQILKTVVDRCSECAKRGNGFACRYYNYFEECPIIVRAVELLERGKK